MKLELIGRVETPLKFSPAFYRTSRGTYVIQGWKVEDASKCQALDFRSDEEELVEVGRVPSSGVKVRHPHNSLSEMPPTKAPPPSAPGTRWW